MQLNCTEHQANILQLASLTSHFWCNSLNNKHTQKHKSGSYMISNVIEMLFSYNESMFNELSLDNEVEFVHLEETDRGDKDWVKVNV